MKKFAFIVLAFALAACTVKFQKNISLNNSEISAQGVYAYNIFGGEFSGVVYCKDISAAISFDKDNHSSVIVGGQAQKTDAYVNYDLKSGELSVTLK